MGADDATATIRIRACRSPRRFLDLQRGFYRDDPHYVPPLTLTEAWQVDPRRNPFFEHGEAGFFEAVREGRCVGRISAAADHLHDEFHGDRIGVFGHFEAADQTTAHALLDTAAEWARAHDREALRGPIDLSTNYRCGLLLPDSEPGPPMMMMPHNPPHYAGWLESWGLTKAKDLLALDIDSADYDTGRYEKLFDRVLQRSGATVRDLDLRRFAAEIRIVWDLYHRIWEKNWGFAPMSRAEFERHAADMKQIARPGYLKIAERAGEPVGFVVGLPDPNPAIRACGGRLLPFGWWRFLRALKKVDRTRVITLGVVPEYRQTGIDMALMLAYIRDVEPECPTCESSWILEDNLMMIRPLMKQLRGRVYRRYRIYERPL